MLKIIALLLLIPTLASAQTVYPAYSSEPNQTLENLVLDKILLLNGSESTIAAKNAGVNPMETGELAITTDAWRVLTRQNNGTVWYAPLRSPAINHSVIYVSNATTATDDRTGLSKSDPDRPFASVSAAYAAASPGDTILISPGTYPFVSQIVLNKRHITIQGVGAPEQIVLEGGGVEEFPLVPGKSSEGTVVKNLSLGAVGGGVSEYDDFSIVSVSGSAASGVFTTGTEHGLQAGDRVRVYGSSMPSGVISDKLYRVSETPTPTTFKLVGADTASGGSNMKVITAGVRFEDIVFNDGTSRPATPLSHTFIRCRSSVAFGTSIHASGYFEDCAGGDYSFGGGYGVASGTFVRCVGGHYSFGGEGTASGSFTNCSGGEGSFGGVEGTASGSFRDCIGGDYSFGGEGGMASGSFTNCSGGESSFGGYGGTASGSFRDCIGGDISFGGVGGNASGTFANCEGGTGSFGGNFGTASGSFRDCIGGDASFGGDAGNASGTFANCEGGNGSFGGSGIASGSFVECTGGMNSFGGWGTASGSFRDCVGGYYSFGGGGTASGTFANCEGGNGSFGGEEWGTASGTFRDCIGGDVSFGGGVMGTASGTFVGCVGGDVSFGGEWGTASGSFTNCVGGAGSFGAEEGTLSGTFTGIHIANASNATFQGAKFYNCFITITGSPVTVSTTGTTEIYNTTITGPGGGVALTSSSPVSIVMTGSYIPDGIHSNITVTNGGDSSVLNARGQYVEVQPKTAHGELTGTAINMAASGKYYKTLSANTTFTFDGTANGVDVVLALTNSGGHTVTWPGGIVWAGGEAPPSVLAADTVVSFTVINNVVRGVW